MQILLRTDCYVLKELRIQCRAVEGTERNAVWGRWMLQFSTLIHGVNRTVCTRLTRRLQATLSVTRAVYPCIIFTGPVTISVQIESAMFITCVIYSQHRQVGGETWVHF